MVVGEGLFVTAFLTLRAAALRRCLATLGANLVEGSYLPQMTADLQSAPFGRSGTPPLALLLINTVLVSGAHHIK